VSSTSGAAPAALYLLPNPTASRIGVVA